MDRRAQEPQAEQQDDHGQDGLDQVDRPPGRVTAPGLQHSGEDAGEDDAAADAGSADADGRAAAGGPDDRAREARRRHPDERAPDAGEGEPDGERNGALGLPQDHQSGAGPQQPAADQVRGICPPGQAADGQGPQEVGGHVGGPHEAGERVGVEQVPVDRRQQQGVGEPAEGLRHTRGQRDQDHEGPRSHLLHGRPLRSPDAPSARSLPGRAAAEPSLVPTGTGPVPSAAQVGVDRRQVVLRQP